jgi:hypothetical protein
MGAFHGFQESQKLAGVPEHIRGRRVGSEKVKTRRGPPGAVEEDVRLGIELSTITAVRRLH